GSSGSGNGNQFQASQKAALTITTTSLPDGMVNQTYSAHLQASGGSGVFTWKVASGTLPAGLALSTSGDLTGAPTTVATSKFSIADGLPRTSSGAVSGIPASDRFTQTLAVTISDSASPPQTVRAYIDLHVKWPPLHIVTTVLPSARVAMPYFAQLAAVGDEPT